MAHNMKITPEHYTYLRDNIRRRLSTVTPQMLRTYLAHLEQDPRVADPHKRLRWDLLHSAGLTPWLCDTLYAYLNDDHIDTALRRVMQELTTTHDTASDSFDN